jgi:hypothetical protein
MSRWTHQVCDVCFEGLEPGRVPARTVETKAANCCMCLEPTVSGIYVRVDPSKMLCRGHHTEKR